MHRGFNLRVMGYILYHNYHKEPLKIFWVIVKASIFVAMLTASSSSGSSGCPAGAGLSLSTVCPAKSADA